MHVAGGEGLEGRRGARLACEAQLLLALGDVLARVDAGVRGVRGNESDGFIGTPLGVHDPKHHEEELVLAPEVQGRRVASLLLTLDAARRPPIDGLAAWRHQVFPASRRRQSVLAVLN